MHVLMAAGGTGGHIEPALNLADALRRQVPSVEVTFLGSDRGLETTLVPERGYELVTVPSVPMPRRPNMDLVRLGPRLRRSVRTATALLRDRGVDVVVGFGGYASVPAYLAARRTRTPLVIHESNARAGLANRLGARFTPYVFVTHRGAIAGADVLAPPLRRSISTLDRAGSRAEARERFGLDAAGPVLLVFGGSQGARRLNEVVAASRPALVESGVQVLHAFGARNEEPAPVAGYVPVPFIDRMDLAYAAADLALTRAGAMTCAELAAVGLPAIYVPLPIGNGEQRLNAQSVVNAGGGLLIDDADLAAEWLTQTVLAVLHDEVRLQAMSEAAARHGVRDADEQLARTVLRVGGAS